MARLQPWAFLTTLRCALGLWLRYHTPQLSCVLLKQACSQAELGDVVYVELPEVGASVTKGEPFGVVESVKVSTAHRVAGMLLHLSPRPRLPAGCQRRVLSY
jgi:hypothetical protein